MAANLLTAPATESGEYSSEFEEHMDNDITLLKDWATIACDQTSELMSKLLHRAEKLKLQHARQFYLIVFFVVSIVISQSLQNNQNTKLLKHIDFLEQQILVNNLKISKAQDNSLDVDRTIEKLGVSGTDLFRIINGFDNEGKGNGLEVELNADISVKNRTYLLNKRIGNQGFVKVTENQDVSRDVNRLVFNSDLILNSVRWNAGMSFLNIGDVRELNDLSTTMNIRLPGSPVEYALHVNFKLDVHNGSRI